MKITRWAAEIEPNENLLRSVLSSEGLEPRLCLANSGEKLLNQKTNLTEIIQVIEGEIIFNLSGTQFGLRAGDRLEIPANTYYSYSNLKNFKCSFLSANKI